MDTPPDVSEISRSPIRVGEADLLSGEIKMKAIVYRGSRSFAANKDEARSRPRKSAASTRDRRLKSAHLMQLGDER